MSDGAFVDATRPPTRSELVDVLEHRIQLWDQLAGWIDATYGLEPEPLYYGKESGWVVRYRRSGKSLVTMMPMPQAIKAVVVIGPSVADRVAELELQSAIRRAFETAHAYPDGRWLTLEVDTPRDVEDITRLIALKSPPPRRPRPRAMALAR